MALSPTTENMVSFTTSLFVVRSLSLSLIRVYLAAVRYHLLCNGAAVDVLKSARLTAVLHGIERRQPPSALARRELSVDDLIHFRRYLQRSNYAYVDQTMLWASVTLAFYGLLRASEYLAPSIHTFDSQRALVWTAVSIAPDSVTLRLKVTKTRQSGDGGTVTVSSTGDETCPVLAMSEFRRTTAQACSAQPVFAFAEGNYLTPPCLNKILRQALNCNQVSSHFMRIGGATLLASRGASEAVIRRAGRWRSTASERYVRQVAGMPPQWTSSVASLRDRV